MARLYLNIAAMAFIWVFMLPAAPADAGRFSALGNLEKGTRAYYQEDYYEAYRQWILLAQRDVARAQHNIGVLYLNGLGVKKSEKFAFEWFRRAAKQGFAQSQHNLGWMYQNGIAIERDIYQARAWYERAAQKKYAASENNLGEILFKNKEYQNARSILQRAARQGSARAQFLLAEIFAHGLGTDIDKKKALRWYRAAANKNDPNAQYKLARFYLDSQDSDKSDLAGNDDQAAVLLWMALAGGNQDAANDLGWMLASDRASSAGGANDALRLFLAGAYKGYAAAAFNVAALYSHGQGVRRSPQKTYMWLLIAEKLAEKNIDPAIIEGRRAFAEVLKPEAREKAESGAQAWLVSRDIRRSRHKDKGKIKKEARP